MPFSNFPFSLSRSFSARTSSHLMLSILLVAPFGVSAQTTRQAEPERIERRFESGITVPSQPAGEVSAPAQQKREYKYTKSFVLNGINFQGVTVYPESDLKAMASKYVGQKVTLSELDAVLEDILARYRTDDYLLVVGRVQDKAPSNGVVNIQVVEGYINNVVVDGVMKANDRGQSLVKTMSEKITQERPLKASTLERYLLLIDDLPGVTAKGIVRRGDGAGAAELLIVMDHKTYDGSLEVNNRGTRFVGRNQGQATLTANSLLGLYERTALRAITTAPTDELRFFDIQHEQQLTAEGTKLKLFASHSDVEPGDSLKSLRVEGRSLSFDVQVESPVIRSRKENFTPRAMFSYYNSEVEALGVDISKDKVRAARIGAAYDIADSWNGVNVFDAEISQGLDFLGATDKGAGRTRIDGESDFTKANLDIARLQNLPHSFSILATASGQYSLDPLLSSEEFAIGGVNYGSAYDSSELTGDHGLSAKVELRWSNQPNQPWLQNYQLYTFYDIGSIWQEDPPAGVTSQDSLASAGLGIRSNFSQYLSATAEVARPLTKIVSNEGDDDTRAFFSLIGRF